MSSQLLEIKYQGYFMCRIATDPDPTNEGRGMSGYTMALATEQPLDQVIQLQPELSSDFALHARPPLRLKTGQVTIPMGVFVYDTLIGQARCDAAYKAMLGARVWLDGHSPPITGAFFNSRNSIAGSDDTMSMVITPFKLRIETAHGKLTAEDHLDPGSPERPIWQIIDPVTYQRRLTKRMSTTDSDVLEAISVYDTYGYFRDRRRYLEKLIADGTALRAAIDPADHARHAELDAELEGYQSRIYQLEMWGERIIDKLNMKCEWEFSANGAQTVHGDLGGQLDTSQPWRQKFWFGGWDGDLLIGYMRGSLFAPFTPSTPPHSE